MKRSLILAIIIVVWFSIFTTVTVFGVLAPEPMAVSDEPAAPTFDVVPTVYVLPIQESEPVIEIEENDQADSDMDTEAEIMYYTEDDVVMMAKLLWSECRGVQSDTEKACIIWTPLNRFDTGKYGNTIAAVVTAPDQFAYNEWAPVDEKLYELALDVLQRWNAERNGEVSVGRVLPADYFWYYGDGSHNHFRNAYRGPFDTWDYSLPSPYET